MIEQQDLEIYDLMLATEQGEEESDSGTVTSPVFKCDENVQSSCFFVCAFIYVTDGTDNRH